MVVASVVGWRQGMFGCVVDNLAVGGGGDTPINSFGGATTMVLHALEVVMVWLSEMLIVCGVGCGTVLSVPNTTLGFGTSGESAVTLGSWACWGWCGATTLVR